MQLDKKTLRNIFLYAIGAIVVYWFLHETERATQVYRFLGDVFKPFVIGAALAFIANVPMRSIESGLSGIKKPGLRRFLAVLITTVLFLVVIAAVFWLLIPQLIITIENLSAKLPGFFARVEAVIMEFLADNPQLMEYVSQKIDLEAIDLSNLIQKLVDMVGTSVSSIVGGAFSAIGTITSGLVNAVVGVVFALYSLFRKEILARQGRRILYSVLPENYADETIRIFRLSNATFSRFLSGQTLEVCILGTMFAISMAIFKMPYIPLVSVLVAVTAFIPIVGAFVGCFFGAFFILVDNPMQAVWFVVMFLVLQQIENNMIYPRVVGTSIGLPGMWVLVAVTVGGEMMGFAGMFLMIPLASVLYTLFGEYTTRRLEARGIPEEKLQEHPPEYANQMQSNDSTQTESTEK